jgi:thiol-disulfide isomerase/thioredoxin
MTPLFSMRSLSVSSLLNSVSGRSLQIGAVLLLAVAVVSPPSSFHGLSAAEKDAVKNSDAPASPPDTAASEVTLDTGTWKDVEAIVTKNRGKIVVVDIWSLSCLPCMEEFPNLVALQMKSPEEIVCVGFNVDYAGIKTKPPETYRPRVEKFLKKNAAAFPNILSSVEAEAVFGELKLVSIPAVYVYDREGKLAKRFDSSLLTDGEEEAFTYKDDINPFVDGLLKSEK